MKVYRTPEFEKIFSFFIDVYVFLKKEGRACLPKFNCMQQESETVIAFINEGLSLFEEGYEPVIFNIHITALFHSALKRCSTDIEIEKIVIIYNYLVILFKEDFYSFLHTSQMWSTSIKHYAITHMSDCLLEFQLKDLHSYL